MKKITQLATAFDFYVVVLKLKVLNSLNFKKGHQIVSLKKSSSNLHPECVTYRRPINFHYTGLTQENINIRIELNTLDLISNNKLDNNFNNIEFYQMKRK